MHCVLQVNECARLALEAVDNGMCVVIGLQVTKLCRQLILCPC